MLAVDCGLRIAHGGQTLSRPVLFFATTLDAANSRTRQSRHVHLPRSANLYDGRRTSSLRLRHSSPAMILSKPRLRAAPACSIAIKRARGARRPRGARSAVRMRGTQRCMLPLFGQLLPQEPDEQCLLPPTQTGVATPFPATLNRTGPPAQARGSVDDSVGIIPLTARFYRLSTVDHPLNSLVTTVRYGLRATFPIGWA